MKTSLKQGLTLIELMAVVTMIIIVTGVVFATYGVGNDSLALDRSSQKLYHDIRFALANSMSGIDNATGAGIHFDKAGSTTSYLIFKNPTTSSSQIFDGNSQNIYASKGILISDWVKLENGVKIISIKNTSGGSSNAADIYFRSPYPTTFLNGSYYQNKTNCAPQADCTISIVIGTNDGSKTKTISINNSGMIDLK